MKKSRTKTLKVRVTKLHIEKGYRGNPSYCPIGLALHSLGLTDVSVGSNVEFAHPDMDLAVSLPSPKCITKFIDRFDSLERDEATGEDNRHRYLKPFCFEIELPVVIPGKIRC